jgi:hypothetical protein
MTTTLSIDKPSKIRYAVVGLGTFAQINLGYSRVIAVIVSMRWCKI